MTKEKAAAMQEHINKDCTGGNSIHRCIVDKTTDHIIGTFCRTMKLNMN